MSSSLKVSIGSVTVGGGSPVAVQTMCNTHTRDVEATVAQCRRMALAGADIIRITVPTADDVQHIRRIHSCLRAEGLDTPLVADIHFSSRTAIAVAPYVEKVRINPGNFHPDHAKASAEFVRLLQVCKDNGTAIRIGVNHGSLGSYITEKYGNTPQAMALAALEWLDICDAEGFDQAVVSLKASNTKVMTRAYMELQERTKGRWPLHLGVTEAGGGDSGRIKSAVGISSLLSRGIGDTLRVSLTEDPVNEIPVGKYIARRCSGELPSSLTKMHVEGRKAYAEYQGEDRARLLLDASMDFGRYLLDNEIDELELHTPLGDDFDRYLSDELMQACRRRFYKPEYIACPGCGRTMYDLQGALEAVKERTSHLKGMVIAVMGCIVNGPGEMADADWGYVGEGGGRVTLYKGREAVLRHVPEAEAPDRLLELIEGRK